jgi:hypothetical protein
VEDSVLWQPLLREALAVLALPADEQVRVNGPGCAVCDLREDFYHARTVALENASQLSEEQRNILGAIDSVVRSMQGPDIDCFNNEGFRRPVWQRLRELAADALCTFGWEGAVVEPFVEVEPGVWRRPPNSFIIEPPESSAGS